MMQFLVFLALAGATQAQNLAPWRQIVHSSLESTDGDIATYEEQDMTTSPRFPILLNAWENFAGFYIQSSGEDFLTDYWVEAVYYMRGVFKVGQVCGATSNFTTVLFNSPDDEAWAGSDTLFIHPTGVKNNGSTVRINEIWPIYANDPTPIFDPHNTAACPPPPPPTTSPVPVVTPTFPSRSDVTLRRWPRTFLQMPNMGLKDRARFDYNLATAYESTRMPDTQIIEFNAPATFLGWYVQSADGGRHITDYGITCWVNGTRYTVAHVTNATQPFTLARFVGTDGMPGPFTCPDEFFLTVTGTNDPGGKAIIQDIFPIYEGDEVIEP